MDFSFLKLYNSIDASIIEEPLKHSNIRYFLPIQLSPDEGYLQITSFKGGISISSDFTAYVVDVFDTVLKDISKNIFIEEFVDYNGNTQCKIEIVNIGTDFYGKKVLIRIDQNASNVKYYTRPIKITNKHIEKTSRFDYSNPNRVGSIDYTNAQCYQSIRLVNKHKGYDNQTEISSYYQISTGSEISYRPLRNIQEKFALEVIDAYTFERLQELLLHNLIYIDGKRIENKPLLDPSEPFGESNEFSSSFTAKLNREDVYIFSFQIYEGLTYLSFTPSGTEILCGDISELRISFNVPITLNTGTIKVYDNTATLIATFDQNLISIDGSDLVVNTVGSVIENLTNGSYYFHVSQGLVSSIYDEQNTAISDNTTWALSLQDGDWLIDDFLSTDWLTSCPPLPNPLVDDLTLFYKFNETSGTTATDDSALGNDGTITNALIDQIGLIDKCYYFNSGGATNQYVTIPDADSLSFGSGDFSIEVWLNADANFGRILNKYNETTGDLEYRLFAQGGVLQFFIYTDASNRIGIADNVTFTTGAWQQIFITYDGSGDASGLTMKVNNVTASFAPVETGTYTGMPNTTQPMILGQQADALTGANRYSGKMDILRMWKGYVVTDTEKTTLYNSGNGTETL